MDLSEIAKGPTPKLESAPATTTMTTTTPPTITNINVSRSTTQDIQATGNEYEKFMGSLVVGVDDAPSDKTYAPEAHWAGFPYRPFKSKSRSPTTPERLPSSSASGVSSASASALASAVGKLVIGPPDEKTCIADIGDGGDASEPIRLTRVQQEHVALARRLFGIIGLIPKGKAANNANGMTEVTGRPPLSLRSPLQLFHPHYVPSPVDSTCFAQKANQKSLAKELGTVNAPSVNLPTISYVFQFIPQRPRP